MDAAGPANLGVADAGLDEPAHFCCPTWFDASHRVVIYDQGLLGIVGQGLQRLTAGLLTRYMENP